MAREATARQRNEAIGIGNKMKRQKNKSSKIPLKKNHSITRQFAGIIIGLVTGTVFLCWLLNTVFLEGYYGKTKQKLLMDCFAFINQASKEEKLDSTDFSVEFDKICSNGNITILVIDSEGNVEKSSTRDTHSARNQFLDAMFGVLPNDKDKILSTKDYEIIKQTDSRLQTDYYVLWGILADGHLIMMRTPLESIRESVKISNQFLAYVGILAVILSAITIYFVIKRVTMPILELTDISRKMIQLDFEAKYEGNGNNEIDQLGAHMNQLSATLEHTISELKSANNELVLDNERKTKIDTMRKEFLSNVSHELKTPIALIQGYAEGLQECVNDDAESRNFYCEVIMDEADKMNQMVKKLLTLNQLEFGDEEVTMERFDLTELIKGVLGSVSILLSQNGITVEFQEEEPCYVWADEFKVEEVITNYLSNAIHHAEFEKKICIFYTKKEKCVRVSVFNTGKNIPEEDIEHIWDKFYKVDKARTREYGGSGIGLSIVKAIMDSFHRECGVQNRENGVEFWLELDTNNGCLIV